MPASRTPLLLSVITLLLLAALIHSGISPYDRTTWLMEVAPVLIVLPLLWLTHRRYPLTPLLYTLIFFHALILIFGGMYSYARVPLGFEVQQWLDLGRNPYDKLGISSRDWCRCWRRARSCCAAVMCRAARCWASWCAASRWRSARCMS